MEKEINYNVLYSEETPRIDSLFELYRKDRYIARVVFMNNGGNAYSQHRLIEFKGDNDDFDIVLFRKKFGISKTNIIYNRESRLFTIKYKNKKFYLISNQYKSIKPLTINNIPFYSNMMSKLILDILQEKFGWLRYIREHEILQHTAFNTIVTKKLFNLKKALAHEYKLPSDVATILHEKKDSELKKILIKDRDYLTNLTSLNEFHFKNHLFLDTVRMGKILNKKVNLKWKSKKLREKHDEFSKLISEIIYVESDRTMSIHPEFYVIEKFYNLTMLKTTKEMYHEGIKNSHCVATYVNIVESHRSAIYTIEDYTLELSRDFFGTVSIKQFRGFKNENAPERLYEEIKNILSDYNEKYSKNNTESDLPVSSAFELF